MTSQQVAETFREDDLVPRLVEEFGYQLHEARTLAPKLTSSTPAVRKAFWHWWQTGDSSDAPKAQGFTLERLMRGRGMTPPAAFAALDWLWREPEHVRAALGRRYDRGAPVRPSRDR